MPAFDQPPLSEPTPPPEAQGWGGGEGLLLTHKIDVFYMSLDQIMHQAATAHQPLPLSPAPPSIHTHSLPHPFTPSPLPIPSHARLSTHMHPSHTHSLPHPHPTPRLHVIQPRVDPPPHITKHVPRRQTREGVGNVRGALVGQTALGLQVGDIGDAELDGGGVGGVPLGLGVGVRGQGGREI